MRCEDSQGIANSRLARCPGLPTRVAGVTNMRLRSMGVQVQVGSRTVLTQEKRRLIATLEALHQAFSYLEYRILRGHPFQVGGHPRNIINRQNRM